MKVTKYGRITVTEGADGTPEIVIEDFTFDMEGDKTINAGRIAAQLFRQLAEYADAKALLLMQQTDE